jgi:hypothetical protein
MFVYLHLVLGPVPAALTSKPLAVQIMSDVLCAFLTFTIGAYGKTIRNYMLTQIAIFIFFLLPPHIRHESRLVQTFREKIELGTLLARTAGLRGCCLAMEWAVRRWYYRSRNASATSRGFRSRWRKGGEGAGSPSLTTRNGMGPAIETW